MWLERSVGPLWGTRASGGLEEVDGEDGDERLERVAEAGMHGDDVVGDGEQQEGAGEESGGGNAMAQRER